MTDHVTDFETASAVDLREVGAWAYAMHPTTEVLCLSFECQGKVVTWYPGCDPTIHLLLCELVDDPDVLFISHGDFERAIWRCIMVPVFGFPDIPNDRWDDTMAIAAQKQVPLNLDDLTKVLGLPDTKDREGSAFTRALSKPNRKTGMLDRSPASMQRVYTYCESDVRSERGVLNRLGRLQPSERKVWLLDQTINQRGVRIDMDYVRACQKIVDEASVPLAAEFADLTGGLKFTQVGKFTEWLNNHDCRIPDLQKATVAEYLGHDIDAPVDDGDIDGGSRNSLEPGVRRALEIRQLAGSASVKKLAAMASCVSPDGRARGLLQYHRAGPGRWAGRLLQPQNFPRPSLKDADDKMLPVDQVVAALQTGDWQYVEAVLGYGAIECVVSGLRHALVADPGKLFISGDFAQIEARVVLALAGQMDKCRVFEEIGSGIYIDMACDIFGLPKPDFNDKKAVKAWKENHLFEYTIGKNTVLGCGFGMGPPKFNDRYCPKQPIEFAERVIRTYRKDWAPMVPPLWYALEEASANAVWTGKACEAYGVEFKLEDGWLTARLPSGRKLFYWNPQKVKNQLPWDPTQVRPGWTYNAIKAGRWATIHTFGGHDAENVVQALARDLLVHVMFLLEAEGLPTVLTVHDEDVVEVEEKRVDENAFRQIMSSSPDWAKRIGIPVAVDTWVGERYRK